MIDKGYVTDRNVLDVGCSHGAGTSLLTSFAKGVVGIDPCMKPYLNDGNKFIFVPTYSFPGRSNCDISYSHSRWEEVDKGKTKVDVVVAMELIEHLETPVEFLDFVADVSEYLFLSTPLAKETAPTGNTSHVVEYSHEDILELLNKRFDILETSYQLGDLTITDKASSNGSSLDLGHVVQMFWCKRKEI
jgi:hypothetical protein